MKIAILSRNKELYSTRRLVDAAEERGHTAVVIDHSKCNLLIEKKNPAVYYKGERIEDIDAIVPRIGASVTFFGGAVVRQFEMMKVFTAVESQALFRSRDKLRSLQVLSRAGLGLPKTIFMNYTDRSLEALNQLEDGQLIIKLLEGTQGLGVILVENKKAAKSVIEAFHNLQARIIIQEFVKEANGADIRAFVVNGEVVGAMKRQGLEGEFRSNLHRGGTSEIIKLKPREQAAALKAARVMGLGVAGVDMLQSKKGPLILEVNSSPGLQGIEKATGVNIAGKIIEYVEKKPEKKRIQKDTINA